jgi:hypothetical protein
VVAVTKDIWLAVVSSVLGLALYLIFLLFVSGWRPAAAFTKKSGKPLDELTVTKRRLRYRRRPEDGAAVAAESRADVSSPAPTIPEVMLELVAFSARYITNMEPFLFSWGDR